MVGFKIFGILLFSALPALIANATSTEAAKVPADGSQFRCEKLRSQTLSDLKAKMVENCDLDRPFSSSMSLSLGEEAYMYCCSLKK